MTTLAPPETPAEPEPAAPAAPETLAELGLSAEAVTVLLLKWLYAGDATGRELAARVRVSYAILEGLLEHTRVEQLIEVRAARGAGTAGYRYALTDRGRDRAAQCFEASGYVGPAPVPLDHYTRYMEGQRAMTVQIDHARVASALSGLVVGPRMIDQLGPAISARRAIFLYGPPGNGKSAMGARIGKVLGGDLHMPHALDVDGQTITLFDPVTHVRQETDVDDRLVRSAVSVDRRWTRVERPVITVGGELTLDTLDLKLNRLSGFYEAPVQLKANGGVLVVDDFGRQRVPARDLLNRWIVPLESRVDYLTLQTGRKFEVPFDVLIVFATNLQPQALADEAFLRRIPYKILANDPTMTEYSAIFELNCTRHGLTFDPALVTHLRREYYEGRGLAIRACHPRDLLDQVMNLCRYRGEAPHVTPALLDEACRTYFLKTPSPTQATASS